MSNITDISRQLASRRLATEVQADARLEAQAPAALQTAVDALRSRTGIDEGEALVALLRAAVSAMLDQGEERNGLLQDVMAAPSAGEVRRLALRPEDARHDAVAGEVLTATVGSLVSMHPEAQGAAVLVYGGIFRAAVARLLVLGASRLDVLTAVVAAPAPEGGEEVA